MAIILIVDDEAGMRQVMLKALKRERHTLYTAEDGTTALELVRKVHPHMVLLDVRLPNEDGLELLRAIKMQYPDIIVIVLSGFDEAESVRAAVKWGAYAFLGKPFKVQELTVLVRRAFQAHPIPHEPHTDVTSPKPKKIRRTIVRAVVGMCVLSIGSIGALYLFRGAPPPLACVVPYENPSAIAYDGKSLWVADWITQKIYQYSYTSQLTLVQSYNTENTHPTGIAFDGTSLWTSNAWEQKIYRHTLDEQLSVAATYSSPGPEPAGLFFDGVCLWICDMQEARIYQTRILEGQLVALDRYVSPCKSPVSIYLHDDNFWVGDARTNTLSELTDEFELLDVYQLPKRVEGDRWLTGIAWDGRSVWTCYDMVPEVFRNPLRDCIKVVEKSSF